MRLTPIIVEQFSLIDEDGELLYFLNIQDQFNLAYENTVLQTT